MKRRGWLGVALSLAITVVASAEQPAHTAAPKPATQPPSAPASTGAAAFMEVARVLQHPRCMNCHPIGDAPLQTDQSRPHLMNISRTSEAAGLECATCHQLNNSTIFSAISTLLSPHSR